MERIAYGNTEVAYEIRRSGSRKTIAVTVNPDASVTVAVPKGTRRTRVAAEVNRKAGWIVAQQDWLRRHYPKRPRQFVSGETFLYLGRQHHLHIVSGEHGGPASVTLARGQFLVALPGGAPAAPPPRVRALLVRWYRRHAIQYLTGMCEAYAARLGVRPRSVRILDMKTRWGSGGPDGQLRLNWRIVMAPRSLVEYVVVHELCHICHGRHSPAFWRLLSRVMPDYEDRRQRLAVLGPTFDF